MTAQDGVDLLGRLWNLLPLLVGDAWDELEPELAEQLEELAAAGTDAERGLITGRILQLCRPHEALREALAEAVRRDRNRSEDAPPPLPWAVTAAEAPAPMRRSARPAGDRWLAAETLDLPAGAHWRAGTAQLLAIGVAGGADRPPDIEPVPEDQLAGPEDIVLTVELRGAAGIEPVNVEFSLPPIGPAAGRAVFRVTPAAPGRLALHAVVLRKDTKAFIQALTIHVPVAPPGQPSSPGSVRSRAIGRPLDAAFDHDDADATLIVETDWITLQPHGLKAPWPHDAEALKAIAEAPRAVLREIAFGVLEDGDRDPVYQEGVTIPHTEHEKALAELVDAGRAMHNELFSPRGDDRLTAIGQALADLGSQGGGPLRVDVWSSRYLVPWHLLAFPGSGAAADQILGLRHRVSYVPTPHAAPAPASLRPADGPLRVVLALNPDLDERRDGRRDLVDGQRQVWQLRERVAAGALTVTAPPAADIADVLLTGQPPAELMYFYCHAGVGQKPGRLTPVTAWLAVGNGLQIYLIDLIIGWPAYFRFDPAPLVVLNACSTLMPQAVYASYAAELLGRGALGIVGTEAEVPAVFAAAWATAFFRYVLDGVPLADAAFRVTHDFLDEHRNLLGLAYALYCDGRIRVAPAVPGDE